MEFHSLPPLSLYIHLPWCVKKCPYCDFNSHAAPGGDLPADEYVTVLSADLDHELPAIWGRSPVAIFIGGGTPSLFPPAAIDRLLSSVRARLNPAPDIEITLEANPGTMERERFEGFRRAGVNRLSVGVQSFDDTMLSRLGRIHDARAAHKAVEAALAAGFDSVNLDLMYGLPGQSVAAAMRDLETAIALAPAHISWYELTIEPNTVFWSSPPERPDPDTLADMEDAGRERLVAAGYERYEISAWARTPELRCQHNLNYWHFGDYVGIGAGAHGKLTLAGEGVIERTSRVRDPARYLERAGSPEAVPHRRRLGPADAALEFLLNALRLPAGFDPALFAERTGVPLASLAEPLAEAEADGLLEWRVDLVRPTERGLALLNDLLGRFSATMADWQDAHDRLSIIPVVSR